MDIEKLQNELNEKVQTLQKVTNEIMESNTKLLHLQNAYIRNNMLSKSTESDTTAIYELKDDIFELYSKYMKSTEEMFVTSQKISMCKDQILVGLNDKLKEKEPKEEK